MQKNVILIANNPSHVDALVPIYKEFKKNNYLPFFITRDSYILKEYKVEHLLIEKNIKFIKYEKFYFNNINSIFYSLKKYYKFKKDLFNFLDKLNFSFLFVCNDDFTLFERVAIEYASKNKKISCLIQESVRPWIKNNNLIDKFMYQGFHELLCDLSCKFSRFCNFCSYLKRGYGFSNCSYIFAAGESYKNNLLSNGVNGKKIIVTGQPKFDYSIIFTNNKYVIKGKKTILFCNQPVKCKTKYIENFFINFIKVVHSLDNVNVVIKLHPRDADVSYWLNLLEYYNLNFDVEVTKNKNLNECFEMADVFVTIASTTCLEAMMRGLPVGLINYLPIDWYLPYNDSALIINNQNELRNSLERLFYDDTLRYNLKKSAYKTIYNEFYKCDGKSAERIFNFCNNIFI